MGRNECSFLLPPSFSFGSPMGRTNPEAPGKGEAWFLEALTQHHRAEHRAVVLA